MVKRQKRFFFFFFLHQAVAIATWIATVIDVLENNDSDLGQGEL